MINHLPLTFYLIYPQNSIIENLVIYSLILEDIYSKSIAGMIAEPSEILNFEFILLFLSDCLSSDKFFISIT